MDNPNLEYQCIGCGAGIQTDSPDAPGYLPKSAFEKGQDTGDFYCQRCFRLRHYNELQDVNISDDVFLKKLGQIAEDDALVINLVDLFDVEGSVIRGLQRFIGNQAFVVAGNKYDLLPKITRENRVRHWLTTELHEHGLRPDDVMLISANRPESLTPIISLIERNIQRRNVYIVGVTNVGKSTLINQLIKHYGGDAEIITTSNRPGTTLDLIRIPLNEDHAIVDTPGVIHRSQLGHYLEASSMDALTPKRVICPKTFQLNPGQTIFLAGVGRMDYLGPEKAGVTFYVSNDVYLHRTKTEGADAFYQKHVGDLLSPPKPQEIEDFPELTSRDFHLDGRQDIAISGLGWLTTTHQARLRLWVPKGVGLSIRDSII